MPDTSTSAVRGRAAQILITRGWKTAGIGDDGAVSADWAIALASGEAGQEAPHPNGPYLAAMAEIEPLLGRGSLLDWEMDPDRTQEQVIALVRDGEVIGGRPPLS